jgi:putative spermidine/putrescine transport system permease protein
VDGAGKEIDVRVLLRVVVVLVYAFLFAPIVFVVLSSFGSSALLAFPPESFTLRWYTQISDEFVAALETSLAAGLTTVVVAIFIGTGLALAIARGSGRLAAALNVVSTAPLAVPHLAIGIALYQACMLMWDVTGWAVAGTFVGLVAGHTIIALPYVVRGVATGHMHFDASVEEAALNLGASRWQTLRRITLPILLPGIISGGFLAFLASFDDVPVALFMGGGENSTTLPLKILAAIEYSFQPDLMAISSLIILASIALMLVLDRFFGLERFLGGGR